MNHGCENSIIFGLVRPLCSLRWLNGVLIDLNEKETEKPEYNYNNQSNVGLKDLLFNTIVDRVAICGSLKWIKNDRANTCCDYKSDVCGWMQ